MFLYKNCGRGIGVVLGCCLVHVFRDAAGVVGCCRCCSGMSFDGGVVQGCLVHVRCCSGMSFDARAVGVL